MEIQEHATKPMFDLLCVNRLQSSLHLSFPINSKYATSLAMIFILPIPAQYIRLQIPENFVRVKFGFFYDIMLGIVLVGWNWKYYFHMLRGNRSVSLRFI